MLLVLVLALPFVAYTVVSLETGFERDRAHALRLTQDTAQLAAAQLDDHLGNLKIALLTISQVAGEHMDAPAEMERVLAALRPELGQHFNSLSVWREDGSSIASLDPEVQKQRPRIADRPYFQDALRTGGLAIEAPIVSRVNGKQLAVMGMPVRTDGRITGMASVSTDLERLQAVVDTHRGLPAGAVVTIVDLNGTVLARSLEPRRWIGQRLPQDPALLRRLHAFGEGSADDGIKGVDGRLRMMGYASLHHAPWLVFVGVPIDAALASANHRLWVGLVLGVLMLGSSLVAAAWLARRLTHPLLRLSAAAEAMGRGERHRIEPGEGPVEVRSLAESWVRMSTDLQRRTDAQRESERMLRDLTDHLPALISAVDLHEEIRFANRAYLEWLGMPFDDVVGCSLRSLSGESVYREMQPYFARALAGERVVYESAMGTLVGPRRVQITLVPRAEEGRITGFYAMILDITEQRSAQARLALSEERLILAMESSDMAMFDWNITANTVYQSALSSVMLGLSAAETTVAPLSLLAWVHPEDIERMREAVVATLKGQVPTLRCEYRVKTVRGEWRWILTRGRVVERNAKGDALRLAGTHVDVTKRHELEVQLRRLADFDTLTGLPNRRLFLDRLDGALARARRHARPLALMFLDIDHFKDINDTCGHATGDRVLQAFADRLRRSVRESDTVARFAGDEFTVIMEDFEGAEMINTVAQTLLETVRRDMRLDDGRVWRISTSVGVAIVTPADLQRPTTTGDTALRVADMALYEAKRLGKDRYCVLDCATALHDPLPTAA